VNLRVRILPSPKEKATEIPAAVVNDPHGRDAHMRQPHVR
jgi:hypothetical protein